MAQHDYVIANGTGAAVRSDINGALAAIVSQNSGATEPTTTYAYMPWADTGSSPPVFKIRNAANNGWITLYELDGTFSVEAGSASSPGLYFTGDINTGIFSAGADQFNIATNGVERVEFGTSEVVFNDGGANYDFRIEGDTNSSLFFVDASAEAVGIGTTSPSSALTVSGDIEVSGGNKTIKNNSGFLQIGTTSNDYLAFLTNNGEKARLDTSGRLLVGTSSARSNFFNSFGGSFSAPFQVEGANSQNSRYSSFIYGAADGACSGIVFAKHRSASIGGITVVQSGDSVGELSFQGSDGTDFVEAGSIRVDIDGTPGANDMPGRLVFSTCKDSQSSPTEACRIDSSQRLLIGKGTADFNTVGISNNGPFGQIEGAANGSYIIAVNRLTNDGDLITFYQAGAQEGSISVSGATVSYNGAHLSRWSQLPGGAVREEILRGTVLTNTDEMCIWGEEHNEQLNRMKVSDVEGDPNVAGVFQAWDDDDDTYTDDFYCAMTGDFIIRIAEGVTVQRGDLMMSAGDGTAKPQDDDIIRSKTVAKVTSTHVTCTYEDGSYCVPCVLMAC